MSTLFFLSQLFFLAPVSLFKKKTRLDNNFSEENILRMTTKFQIYVHAESITTSGIIRN